jgi:hypothetical protein
VCRNESTINNGLVTVQVDTVVLVKISVSVWN